jgi:UDP-N-acetylmuramate--alanine ligase
MVAEVDESDGSMVNIRPNLALIVNIDFDHPDHFRDLDAVRDCFAEFVGRMPGDGLILADADDPGVESVRGRFGRRMLRCSLRDREADLFADGVELGPDRSTFAVHYRRSEIGRARLFVGGIHNVRNALLAVGAGLTLCGAAGECLRGLESFRGVCRRFEFKGQAAGARVYDDYAHHPREIEATLAVAARMREADGGRVVAIFQPHRYTRTQALWREFGAAFAQADIVAITDVYGAGDTPVPGVTGALVAGAARDSGHRAVSYCPTLAEAAEFAVATARPDDIIVTLGAGDITSLGPTILERLERGGSGA